MLRINPQWLLTVNWGDVGEVHDPAWQHVLSAINSLNGSMQSELSLSSPQLRGKLVIGGGNSGRYLVSFFPDAQSDYRCHLAVKGEVGSEVEIDTGTKGNYPARWCINIDYALKVAKYYFFSQELLSESYWEELPDKAVAVSKLILD